MAGWTILVEARSEAEAAALASHLEKTFSAVVSVTDHGAPGHCCCKNCPWNGDHE